MDVRIVHCRTHLIYRSKKKSLTKKLMLNQIPFESPLGGMNPDRFVCQGLHPALPAAPSPPASLPFSNNITHFEPLLHLALPLLPLFLLLLLPLLFLLQLPLLLLQALLLFLLQLFLIGPLRGAFPLTPAKVIVPFKGGIHTAEEARWTIQAD